MSRPVTGPVLVTGTDTGVGKTVVTAAIAAAATSAGLRVAVVKPAQTGAADEGTADAAVIARLAAPATTATLAEFPDPLAPLVAARVAGASPLAFPAVVDAVRAQLAEHDLVLVEGAGGLLVPMGIHPSGEPWTVADLARRLGAGAVVVARAGLGTLNHTALTREALTRRGVPWRVVIGSWPARPERVHWTNLAQLGGDLVGHCPHLAGAVPEGAGGLPPDEFRRSAPGWLAPQLYGARADWHTWASGATPGSGG